MTTQTENICLRSLKIMKLTTTKRISKLRRGYKRCPKCSIYLSCCCGYVLNAFQKSFLRGSRVRVKQLESLVFAFLEIDKYAYSYNCC
jgi:hypothetical protein